MKNTSTKPSGLAGSMQGVRAHPAPGAAVLHHTAAPAPSARTLFVKDGRIARTARPPRIKRVPVAFTARIVRGLLVVPEVLNEIEFRERLVIVKAAIAMILQGLSQNHAADALGVTRSRLSVWLQKFGDDGEEALRPAPWNAGRKPAKGRAQRHAAFIELKTRR